MEKDFNPTKSDIVRAWLIRHRKRINLSQFCLELQVTRAYMGKYEEGKIELPESLANKWLLIIRDMGSTEIKAEVVRENTHGLIMDGDI